MIVFEKKKKRVFVGGSFISFQVFGCTKSVSVLSQPRLICTRGKDATFATTELISTPTFFVLFTLAHLYARVFFLSLPLPDFSETDIPVIGEGKHTLKIEATCCNIKKIDLKFYGIEKATCQVTIKCNGKEWKTTEERGLDPTWEQHVIFKINDPETDKISAVFHCAGIQLGDEQFYSLDKLLKGKQTFKGLVVPGGKADMLFTAVDFGSEEAQQEDDAFMDFL